MHIPMRELILPLKPQQTRKYPRVRAKFRVNCTVGNQTFPARASTLGGGGLFLDTDRPLAKGTEVHARFRPAKHLPQIEAKARVCYVLRGRGVALEFMGLTPDQLQILLRMIHRKPSDRRDFARAPLATQIQSQDCMALAFARNVGEGGMFIETKDPLPLGVKLNLRFNLNDDGPAVVAVAEVTYTVSRMGMGVQFLDLAPADRKRIETHVVKAQTADQVAAGTESPI